MLRASHLHQTAEREKFSNSISCGAYVRAIERSTYTYRTLIICRLNECVHSAQHDTTHTQTHTTGEREKWRIEEMRSSGKIPALFVCILLLLFSLLHAVKESKKETTDNEKKTNESTHTHKKEEERKNILNKLSRRASIFNSNREQTQSCNMQWNYFASDIIFK